MGIGVVIVAAGNGTRMGGTVRKLYLKISGVPILVRTIQQFIDIGNVAEIVLVVHSDEAERTKQLLQENGMDQIKVVFGGVERQDSVYAGVQALSDAIDTVLIHDGARPFVRASLIRTLIEESEHKQAIIPAIPVKDTIKVVQQDKVITSTPDRRGLWAAQTPQAFSLALIRSALQEALARGWRGTDDASLLEAIGHPVHVIEGETTNIKITTPEDLLFGEALVRWMEEHT